MPISVTLIDYECLLISGIYKICLFHIWEEKNTYMYIYKSIKDHLRQRTFN